MTNDADRLREALRVLQDAGAVFYLPPASNHLCLAAVAARLDCSVSWVRQHLQDFPNAWRMPGGELRIPSRDVEELAKRGRLQRPSKYASNLTGPIPAQK